MINGRKLHNEKPPEFPPQGTPFITHSAQGKHLTHDPDMFSCLGCLPEKQYYASCVLWIMIRRDTLVPLDYS